MHEREAVARGLRYSYRLIDLDKLNLPAEAAVKELLLTGERRGFHGFNITHPCKQSAIAHLTELSDEARAIGAVNTVVLRDGRRIGHNTDASGFAKSFNRGLAGAALRHVVLLGAGGAGAAVAHTILAMGAGRLTIFDTENKRADRLATGLCARFGCERAATGVDLEAAMADADGLIHATPTGMASHPGLPLPEHLLRREHWLAEIVYFPLQTELLRVAGERGCRILDGSGMAVFQAVEAFRLFTGIPADADRMLRHFISMGEC
jgi:shikimate dehydrogenase